MTSPLPQGSSSTSSFELPGEVVVKQGRDDSPDKRMSSIALKFTDASDVEHTVTGPIRIEGRLEDINMVAIDIFRNLLNLKREEMGPYSDLSEILFENVTLIEKDELGNKTEHNILDLVQNLKPSVPNDSGYQSTTSNDFGRPKPNINIIESRQIEERPVTQTDETRAARATQAPRDTDHRVVDFYRLLDLTNEYFVLSADLTLLEEERNHLETINEAHQGKIVRKMPENERKESLEKINILRSNISERLKVVSSRLNKLDTTGTLENDITQTIKLKNTYNSVTNTTQKKEILTEIQKTQERISESLYKSAKLDTEPKNLIDLPIRLSDRLTKKQDKLKRNMHEMLENSKDYKEATSNLSKLETSVNVYNLELDTRAFAYEEIGRFWRGIGNQEEYRQLLSDMFPKENIDQILIAPVSFLHTRRNKIEKLLNESNIDENQFKEILDDLMLVAGISNYASFLERQSDVDYQHLNVLMTCDYTLKKREHEKKKTEDKKPSVLMRMGEEFWGDAANLRSVSKEPPPEKYTTNKFLRELVLNIFDDFSVKEENYDRLNMHKK